MEKGNIFFCPGHGFRHMKDVGIYHSSASGGEIHGPSRGIVGQGTALHIKNLHGLVPVPGRRPPDIY